MAAGRQPNGFDNYTYQKHYSQFSAGFCATHTASRHTGSGQVAQAHRHNPQAQAGQARAGAQTDRQNDDGLMVGLLGYLFGSLFAVRSWNFYPIKTMGPLIGRASA